MSAVIVLTPVVISAWPIVAASVTAAVAGSGFRLAGAKGKTKARNTVELDVSNVEIVADALEREGEIAVERRGVRVVFSRDGQGRLKTCVSGDLSKERLRSIGDDLAGRVVQQYVYHRVNEELGNQGFVLVEEELGQDEAIKLHVRRYEG